MTTSAHAPLGGATGPRRAARALAARAYAWAFACAPEDLRAMYGDEMRRTFDAMADGAAAVGVLALIRLLVTESADILRARLTSRRFTVANRTHLIPGFRQLRQAARSLARRPAFALAAIATLALSTAGTTTMFAVVNTVLLRPLPYPAADRLVTVYESSSSATAKKSLIAPGRLEDWRQRSHAFDAMAGHYFENVTDTSGENPERLSGMRVTPGYFDVFGTAPLIGRTFAADEERFNGPGAALINESLWEARYQRDPNVLDRHLVIGGQTVRIVGVLPRTFALGSIDVWLPGQLPPGLFPVRDARFLNGVARVKAGTTLAEASRDLADVQRALGREYPRTDADWTVQLGSMHDARVGASGRPLWLVFAAVGLLWLIGVANMAGLMLVQLKRREREMAIRTAIGGSRIEIAGVVLHEVVLIAAAGAALGVWMASGLRALVPSVFRTLPRLLELSLDWRGVVFAIASSAAAAVLFGVWPVIGMTRAGATGLTRVMSQGARGATAGRHGLQTMLVIGQVALSLLLVGAASLFVETYVHLSRVDVGFSSDDVVMFHVAARWDEDRARLGLFQEALVNGLAATPGVESAGFVNFLPLTGANLRYQATVDGLTGPETGGALTAGARVISADYFRTLRARLVDGAWCPALKTDFTAKGHAIVNRAFAEAMGPGTRVVGRDVRGTFSGGVPLVIDGVVDNLAEDGPRVLSAPYLYTCDSAGSWPDPEYVVRTKDARGIGAVVRQLSKQLDPSRAVFSMAPLVHVNASALDEPRLHGGVLAGFAVAALSLAALGLYSLFTLLVGERTREIGVLLALGAAPGRIVSEVAWRAGRLLVAGVLIGLALTACAERWIGSSLFGVAPLDPLTLGGATLVLAVVCALAIAMPAARAAQVDPLAAMRRD
jgi:predicted permease